MLSDLEQLKPITINWVDTRGMRGEKRLHADSFNRWLEDRLPFALTPTTEIGRNNGNWSLCQTAETHQIFAFNECETKEILADWYDSTEAKKVRPWAPRKRDGDLLRLTYRNIADAHAGRVVELTGVEIRASEIAWDYSNDRNALLAKLSDDEEGLPAEDVARTVIAAAENEITRWRNLYQRMRYNVVFEHAKQVDVAGDDMQIVRAWCREFRMAQKRYLGGRESMSCVADRVKADIIDLVRKRNGPITEDSAMLIDPECIDEPYDGVRAQQYMMKAKDALKRLDAAVAERDRLCGMSCEEIKYAEIEREIDKVADYWRRSWKKCADDLEFGTDSKDSTDLRLQSGEFCQDRMCPLCADRMAYKERERMMAAFEYIENEHGDDVTYLFLTLTIPNVKDCELDEALKAMHDGFNSLTHESWWKDAVLGWYRADEITHTKKAHLIRAGLVWHPHIHLILAVPASYFTDGKYMEQDKIRRAWHRHMIMWGDAEQVNIKRIHAKQSESDIKATTYATRGLRDGLAETIKYSCKTSDYLVRNREERRRRVEVLHEAMLGTKMHASGGLIKAALKAIEEQFSDDNDLIHTEALTDEDEGVRAPWLVTAEWTPRLGAYVVTGRVRNVDDDDIGMPPVLDQDYVRHVQMDLFGSPPGGDSLGVAV